MFTCKTDIKPSVFSDIYRLKPINKDLRRPIGILSKPYYQGKCFEFIISFCESHIWNKVLAKKPSIADIQSPSLFKTIINTTTFNTVNLKTEFYSKILKCS